MLLLLLLLPPEAGDETCEQAEGGEEETPHESDTCVGGEDIESQDEAVKEGGTYKDWGGSDAWDKSYLLLPSSCRNCLDCKPDPG